MHVCAQRALIHYNVNIPQSLVQTPVWGHGALLCMASACTPTFYRDKIGKIFLPWVSFFLLPPIKNTLIPQAVGGGPLANGGGPLPDGGIETF